MNPQHRLIALLVLSVFINYVDRGNLSIAAPVLSAELALSPTQLGLLFSAFFWTYAILQIGAGWMVDRFGVFWVFAGGYMIWSLATLATGFTGTFASLFAMRLLLGAGESVAYPAYSRIIAAEFPEERRGLTNALVDAGSKAGPALGTLFGGLLVANYGWRILFISTGLLSLLWLAPWWLWAPRDSAGAARQGTGPGIMDILRRRQAWGTSLGFFCFGYAWYFLLSWLPTYLVNERHLSMNGMAVFGSLVYVGVGVSSVFCGWLSDRWIRGGSSPTRVRKTFLVSGLLLCMLMLPAAMATDSRLAMALLIAASLSMGLFTSNVWAVTQTLAGPLAAGKWSGIQNCVGNLGGVVSPFVTGLIVTQTHSFLPAFAIAALMLFAGAAAFLFLVDRVEPLDWSALSNRDHAG
ncbi:MAG: MFS transporter [Bryobacteraceae bacterium]